MSAAVRTVPRPNSVRCMTMARIMPSTSVTPTEMTVMITVTFSACHQYGELSTAA